MRKIEFRNLDYLREHPKNQEIFGDIRQDSELFERLKESILVDGIQEPIIIRSNGTVLSGHIRLSAVYELLEQKAILDPRICKATKNLLQRNVIPCRVHPDFDSEEEETDYLILSNTLRRQLTPEQRAQVTTYLRKRDKESPLKRKYRKKGEADPPSRTSQFSDAEGLSERYLNDEATIMNHPLVTGEMRAKLNSKEYSVTQVMAAIRRANTDSIREGRNPTPVDLQIALDNPVEQVKPTPSDRKLVDVLRTPTPVTPKLTPKVEVPKVPEPIVKAPEPVVKAPEAPKVPETPPPTPKVEVKAPPPPTPKAPPPVIPNSPERQLLLVDGILDGLETEVDDPIAIRDLLLTISSKAKMIANRLSKAPKVLVSNGLHCPECGAHQYPTTSGVTCENGHGGLDSVTKETWDKILAAREVVKGNDKPIETPKSPPMVKPSPDIDELLNDLFESPP